MFILNSRNFIQNIINSNIQYRFIDNDKIKINKFNIYHDNRNNLNDYFIQMKIYLIFNTIFENCKILFVTIFFKKKTMNKIYVLRISHERNEQRRNFRIFNQI